MIKGSDVIIHKNAEITRPELCVLGNHIAIDYGFYCTTELIVGDYVHISPHVAVIGGKRTALRVQDFCFISTGAKLICGSETFEGNGLIGPVIPDEFKENQILLPITLKRFSGVCANTTVMPGITMAEGSILGANSFLNQDTEPWTIYVGSPARPLKIRKKDKLYEYAAKLGYHYNYGQ